MSGSVESKIFMVSVDSDDVRGGQEDVPPSVEPMDNRKELSVVNVIQCPKKLFKCFGGFHSFTHISRTGKV